MGRKLKCGEVAVMEGVNIRTINVRCKSTPPYYPTAVCIARRWYIDSDDPQLGGKGVVIPENKPPEKITSIVTMPENKNPDVVTIKDQIALIQAETGKINVEIAKEEALGRRDKPAKLAEREIALNNRETAVSNKEIALNTREVEITARLTDLNIKEKEFIVHREEADNYYTEKTAQGNSYYGSKKKEADLMEATLNELQKQINEADAKIAEYPAKLAPIYSELDQLVKVSNQWGMHYYKKAQNTEMQESRNHSRRSSKFFDLGDMFSKVKEWMGT